MIFQWYIFDISKIHLILEELRSRFTPYQFFLFICLRLPISPMAVLDNLCLNFENAIADVWRLRRWSVVFSLSFHSRVFGRFPSFRLQQFSICFGKDVPGLHTSMVFEHTAQVELVIFAIIGLIYRLPLALLLTLLCNYYNCIKR